MTTLIVTIAIGIAIASALCLLYVLMTSSPRTSRDWVKRYNTLTREIVALQKRIEEEKLSAKDYITLSERLAVLYDEQTYAADMVRILQEREEKR